MKDRSAFVRIGRSDSPGGENLGSTGSNPKFLPSQETRNCEVLQCRVTITNPDGLHLRPVATFAKRAAEFQASVTVIRGTTRVNGKVAMELLTLGAEQGAEVILEVAGCDARTALAILADILARASWDDDSNKDPVPPKG